LVLIAIVAIAIVALPHMKVPSLLNSASPQNNARCPLCGEEWHVNYHRGNAQWVRKQRCPECGEYELERVLDIMYEQAHAEKQ
jgi:predicted RNA-binding Zn-ribbon protein involved in translation (DUF1610 family)